MLAPLLAGIGFALWVALPSYAAFAAGFVLWGAQGALQSGALEALVYEELEHESRAPEYATLMGRATAAGTIAAAAAMGLAAPVLGQAGFTALGVASALACVAAALVASGFPEHRTTAPRAATARPTFGATLREAATHLRRSPPLRRLLLAAAAVTAIWGSLDEYLPLLAVEAGAALTEVALLGLLVYAAMSAGGLLAGRAERLSARGLGRALIAAAAALAAGALTRSVTGFLLIAVAFAGFQALTVAADARVQAAIDGAARATVTSVGSLMTEVLVLGVLAAYAAGSGAASHAALFAAAAALFLPVALLLSRAASSGTGNRARGSGP